MNAEKKLVKARAALVLEQPFFAALALRMPCIVDESIETMATDGNKILYSNEFVNAQSSEHLKSIIAHEVMHVACEHTLRRNNRDPKKWNVAADYAINQILIDSSFSLPDGALLNKQYNGLSAEQIYNRLPVDDSGNDNNQHNNKGVIGAGSDPGKMGAVIDSTGPGESSAKASADIRATVAQAAQQAKAAGQHLPQSIQRLINEILNPKIDWRDILHDFVSQCARNDYTTIPPNRRYAWQSLYLPSLRSNQLGELVIAIDTSGSIDINQLNQFCCELSAIRNELMPATTHIIYCDTAIRGYQQIDQYSEFTPQAVGGGGTDLRAVFDHIDNNGITPDCLVCFTDLHTPLPVQAPYYPVLWARHSSNKTADFGAIVDLD